MPLSISGGLPPGASSASPAFGFPTVLPFGLVEVPPHAIAFVVATVVTVLLVFQVLLVRFAFRPRAPGLFLAFLFRYHSWDRRMHSPSSTPDRSHPTPGGHNHSQGQTADTYLECFGVSGQEEFPESRL